MGLGQLVVERDGVAEESRGLQDQLDKAEAMVGAARVESVLGPGST